MPTFGENILKSFEDAVEELTALVQSEYDKEKILSVLSDLGTKLEIYFKSAVFYSASSRLHLVDLINQLPSGITSDKRSVLNQFRQRYNSAKHERSFEPNLLEILDLIKNVKDIVD